MSNFDEFLSKVSKRRPLGFLLGAEKNIKKFIFFGITNGPNKLERYITLDWKDLLGTNILVFGRNGFSEYDSWGCILNSSFSS